MVFAMYEAFGGFGLALGGPISSFFYDHFGVEGPYCFFIGFQTLLLVMTHIAIKKSEVETDLTSLSVPVLNTSQIADND